MSHISTGGGASLDNYHAWTIRYMVIDTRNWLPGKKILVAPRWIATVDWKNSNVYVNLSCVPIKSGPEFNSDKLDHEYETELYKHYGQESRSGKTRALKARRRSHE